MTMNSDDLELRERLNLIESMIAEGRRSTESWGWVFVLWGVAYYVAIAWSIWIHSGLAWPVTMIAAFLLTVVLAARKRRKRPATAISRAISAIWRAMGISMFVVLLSLGMAGRYEPHVSVAICGAMLGSTNAASSMILRWKMQFACAVVWWAAAVAALFGSANQSMIAFLVAIFFCQILFGLYAMAGESRKRRQGAVHA